MMIIMQYLMLNYQEFIIYLYYFDLLITNTNRSIYNMGSTKFKKVIITFDSNFDSENSDKIFE